MCTFTPPINMDLKKILARLAAQNDSKIKLSINLNKILFN